MNIIGFLCSFSSAAADTTAVGAEGAKWTDSLKGLPLEQVIDKLFTGMVDLAIKLLIAVVVFYGGKLVINRIHKSIKRILTHRQVERSLTTFILSLVKIVLLFILIIIVISILGIETSSFIALFASAGVAIGMALSGTLQNFAGGVLILLLKPYKVGDFIEFQGFTGSVKEIQIFNTILNTPDNKWISIPNGGLSTGSINNYSKEEYRRVDWTVSIAYGDDFDVAKREILRILGEDSRIVKQYVEDDREQRLTPEETEQKSKLQLAATLKKKRKSLFGLLRRRKKTEETNGMEGGENPAIALPRIDRSPVVVLGSLSASSVDIIVRVWTPTGLFWGVYYDINERFYRELPLAGLHFPFPQMDVHIN